MKRHFAMQVCALLCAAAIAAPGTYRWRGVHLDESRHFFGKEAVKRLLDRMAEERLNVFHWHLTDDQGWRIEIRKYPNLTKRGAQRKLVKDWKPQPFWHDERTEGIYGPYFYTQDDIREIVSYAHARGIRVMPEIEMPGHSLAALASYPELCCFPEMVRDCETFLHPSYKTPGRNMRTYCIGSDDVVRFLEDVLDEVCELFPDDVIHIGGDEAPQGNWKECPKCQARMKANGLADELALQGWLMNHFIDYLAKKGRRTMGWEEMLAGKPDPKNVIAQCWHGPDRALKVVEAGYDAVMSPPRFCYFDYSQGIEGDNVVYNNKTVVSAEKVASFDPVAGIPEALHSRVLGAECCNWSEATVSPEWLERKLWPRTSVFAQRLLGVKEFSMKATAGVPRIAVDGEPLAGMCALPQPRLGPDAVTFSMKDFGDFGVRFFSDIWWAKGKHNDWWLGEGAYDFEAFDRRARGLLAASPSGFIFPRLKMDPPDWWAKDHPDDIRANEARPDSEAWRALYRRMLEDVVRHVESSSYADRVMGYHIGALHGSEWLVWPWPKDEEPPVDWDERDPLPPLAATAARRAYIRKRNKDIADDLLDAAERVKRMTGGKKLVGAFFAYMGNGDHEDSSRVLRSPYIDFLSSPGSYSHRRAGQSGRFQLAWPASCRLHGKLYWDESDIRTYLAKGNTSIRCTTPEESVDVIKRNIGYALTGGWEVWWFLLAGNKTFHDEALLAPIRAAFAEETRTLRTAQWKPADVAVFTSPDEYSTSVLSLRRGAPLRVQCKVGFHLSKMPCAGVAYDSYDLADIEDDRLPDYKVYVFPNAFTLSEERREAIKRRVRRPGKTAIWLFAPGYYRNGEGSAANIEELACVRVKERYPVADGPISRTFEAEGDGVFSTNGWRSVYLPVPLEVDTLRKVFAEAGAHIWIDTPEFVSAGRGYLMVHSTTGGEKTIRLPAKSDVAEIYGASEPRTGVTEFRDRFRKGETKIYRLQ